MSFRITQLDLTCFRNYREHTFTFDEDLTILHGMNAVGKTAVIEAIQLLCEATTFRRSPYHEMIHYGCARATIALRADDTNQETPRSRTVRAVIEPHHTTYRVNGKETSASAGILGALPVVVFTPDNLRLIKDAAARRREEVDGLGKQLSANYARLCREYTKTLKGRNRLLADNLHRDPAFEAWTDQLARVGVALFCHRARLLGRLNQLTRERFARIDPTAELGVSYRNNWVAGADATTDTDELVAFLHAALAEGMADDIARKTTGAGPHRDDVVFTLDGHDARAYGSQGQQRTIALAWKLAAATLVEEVLGTRPILLLDDVMSELDASRRAALMAQVGEGAQTIITTTNTHYFEPTLLKRAKVIEIKRGTDTETTRPAGGKAACAAGGKRDATVCEKGDGHA